METYKIQVGQVDSGKFKDVEVALRRVSQGERAEIRRKGKINRKVTQTGVEGDLDEDIISTELIVHSVLTPVEMKKVDEIDKLDPVDYDNLLKICLDKNPLGYRPTLSEE